MALLLRKVWQSMREATFPPPALITEESSESHMLPHDILLAIFSYLSSGDLRSASFVCKAWHAVAIDDILWGDLLKREAGETWSNVLFAETFLRPGFCMRLSGTECALPSRLIYCQRSQMPNCVVIDGGSGYCKFGWSYDKVPVGKLPTFLEFGSIESPMHLKFWDLFQVIFGSLQAKPSAQPVLVTVPICNSDDANVAIRKQSRQMTCQVLFDMGVPAVCTLDQAVLALYAARLTSGIVVNIGFHMTSVVPILHGKVMRNLGVEIIGQGALRLTGYLSELMQESGIQFATMYTVRTLKEKLCYVAEDFEAEKLKNTEASCRVAGEGVFTLREERYRTGEILFKPQIGGMRAMGLHQAVGLCIEHCANRELSNDIHKGWYKNIVLAGGSANLPGLAGRLAKELHRTLDKDLSDGISIQPPLHNDSSAWFGAKVLTNLSTFERTWCISKKQYRQKGPSMIHTVAVDEEFGTEF
ncbi:hypothetical protein O6H91_07G110800 [Diphasiastrum complanatum]|uniref:Uncharacterized protein n=4 Tax=Diphasiastrum complanatum TaxID=34168 RepID=A0ACC2D921_DIPCM|nr:hypothetical protein O6H91_07G110800 [Diphasiastrum complanatum]KAJ7550643.1 hypothetical protein O6H91_07G110800 [Diphasiastrum complanatum]KAJ7550645.1 hypothetical protein O6H91_07G110800 [Diphasiastrum complanatum]KAJ7550646.1 hypothetical protein O6H91_07G110800 [Diphasiastrum complanatum]